MAMAVHVHAAFQAQQALLALQALPVFEKPGGLFCFGACKGSAPRLFLPCKKELPAQAQPALRALLPEIARLQRVPARLRVWPSSVQTDPWPSTASKPACRSSQAAPATLRALAAFTAAAVRAVAHFFPHLVPLLAPGERPPAVQADFLRQVGFFSHAHGNGSVKGLEEKGARRGQENSWHPRCRAPAPALQHLRNACAGARKPARGGLPVCRRRQRPGNPLKGDAAACY